MLLPHVAATVAWTNASSRASISLATRSTYRRRSMLTAPMNSSAEIPHRISKIPANDFGTAIGGVLEGLSSPKGCESLLASLLRLSETMSCHANSKNLALVANANPHNPLQCFLLSTAVPTNVTSSMPLPRHFLCPAAISLVQFPQ